MSLQLLLREAHEQTFGIFNHITDSKYRPLAVVAMHDKENSGEYSAMHRVIYKYMQYDIKNLFGLSIAEFLAHPRHECEWMYKAAADHMAREAPKIQAALTEAAKMSNLTGKRK